MLVHAEPAIIYDAYLSAWKTGGLAILFLAMAILPLTPDFGNGLFFTAIFYRFPFSIIRFFSSIGCGFFAVVMMKFFIMALQGRPTLKIENGAISTFGISNREFRMDEITSLTRQKSGNALIKVSGQKGVSIPLFILRDPEQTWQYIEKISSPK